MTARSTPDPKALIEARLATAEAALDKMYDAREMRDAEWQFSLAKDCFRDAILAAEEAGLADEATKIMQRLVDVKAAFRSQFRR